MILDTFPSAEKFYKTYWGKKPFIVRGYIPEPVIESLIDGDNLAGLALEEDIRSRIITNNAAGDNWECEHGPFEGDRFDDIGDKDWSLLVQNVEQYHTETAELLKHFHFSPRWLIDDIMVSFSAPGGSVGPHTDSYHTFLVQGIGKRAWKISNHRIEDNNYADNLDMKVLKNGFEGETYEVTAGDVIYMPPFFGHEGKTLEPAMTFSVGFLGPKLSEMLGEYAHYLEENEEQDKRYLGSSLDIDSSSFTLCPKTKNTIRDDAIKALQSDDFSIWMASYFSRSTHEDIKDLDAQHNLLSSDQVLKKIQNGNALYRTEHIKIAITSAPQNGFNLAIYGEVISVSSKNRSLIGKLNTNQAINSEHLDKSKDKNEAIEIITTLYNKNVLFFRQ